jgi:hypothetical protein
MDPRALVVKTPEELIEVQAMVLNITGKMSKKFPMENLPLMPGHIFHLFVHKRGRMFSTCFTLYIDPKEAKDLF